MAKSLETIIEEARAMPHSEIENEKRLSAVRLLSELAQEGQKVKADRPTFEELSRFISIIRREGCVACPDNYPPMGSGYVPPCEQCEGPEVLKLFQKFLPVWGYEVCPECKGTILSQSCLRCKGKEYISLI